VRMGVHTGSAELRDNDYYGTAVNRAARLMSAGHGGQIVVSLATEELVQESGVELLDLGEHLLRDLARPDRVFQVVHPELRREFPRLSSLDAFPGNLPAQVTSFVGRDDDLAIIAALLDVERLVTVTGVGGVGKTRLAIEVATSVLQMFPDGTWLCELAAANDGDTMEQVVAATFGVVSREGMSIGGAVREFLRTKTLLVVFDNCEHLLEPVGRLAHAVLRGCPHVRILATSRERLGVDGEHVRVLRSLDLPEVSAEASSIARSDAARLFIDRARAVNASLVLDTSTVAAIGELCRHLDGVPLAIELAAARVGAMSPAEIVAHLDERFRLLRGGRRNAIDRHQTLRATVDWSYSLLTGTEQLVFTRLGTFPNTFDAAAAEAVATGGGIEGLGRPRRAHQSGRQVDARRRRGRRRPDPVFDARNPTFLRPPAARRDRRHRRSATTPRSALRHLHRGAGTALA
jgi:Adenylate and Guanylate cyclase catalytic domain